MSKEFFTPYQILPPIIQVIFHFKTIKLCDEISNFANIKVKFTLDCLVKNTTV